MANKFDFARALQGFGAGVQGKGMQFNAGLDQSRKQALVDDSFSIMQRLQQNNVPAARQLLLERLDHIKRLGGDDADTRGVLQKIDTGDVQGALADVSMVVDHATRAGMLNQPQQPQRDRMQVVDGQIVNLDQGTAGPIPGYVAPPGVDPAADRQIRREQLALQQQIEQRQQTKLSAGLEKVMLDSQQSSIDRQGDAINFNTMAQEFETRSEQLYGGAAMTVNEAFKTLLGTQDDVTELRRKINAIRVAEGIGQLPPGVASDKDIELVMSGQIRENASPEQVASYLRGAAKAAQYAAGYNQMRVDFISKNRTGAGLNNAWRKMRPSSKLGRDVAAAEIYRTALSKGVTAQQVMADLGIEGDILEMGK